MPTTLLDAIEDIMSPYDTLLTDNYEFLANEYNALLVQQALFVLYYIYHMQEGTAA